MLEKNFSDVYSKFKMGLYAKIFNQDVNVDTNLSATEVICVELIYALDNPTVNEFATFAQISAPNAAYKVNSLVKKGYIRKVQSEVDKREFHLEVTDKYMESYGVTYDYMDVVMKRIRERFPEEDVAKLDEMLNIITTELMPEVQFNTADKPQK